MIILAIAVTLIIMLGIGGYLWMHREVEKDSIDESR